MPTTIRIVNRIAGTKRLHPVCFVADNKENFMDKVYRLLPMGLFCSFIGKLVFFGVNPSECGVALGLTGLIALKEYVGYKKNQQLEEVIKTVNMQNDVIAKMATEIDNLKTSLVGIKMGAGFKNKMGA